MTVPLKINLLLDLQVLGSAAICPHASYLINLQPHTEGHSHSSGCMNVHLKINLLLDLQVFGSVAICPHAPYLIKPSASDLLFTTGVTLPCRLIKLIQRDQ